MNTFDSIRNKVSGKSSSPDENLVMNICIVMREFHLNYKEVLELPFPTFLVMLNVLEKEAKQSKSKSKGMQKHKH